MKQCDNSVKKNVVLNTAYQILSLAVPFVTTPYISRVLGADGIGVYSFTSSIAAYFSMIAALGTMSYGAREISRARNDRKLLSRLFWEIESLAVISTIISIVVWSIWVVYSPEYNLIYLVLTMTLLGTMTDISWFFTGLEQFKFIVIRNALVKIIGVILLFAFIKAKDDLSLYIFLMTLTNFLGFVSMWVYIPKMVDRIELRSIRLKKHFKETFIYFVPTIATSVYTVLNKVLLGFLGGDIRENGYYEQAIKIIAIAQTLTFTALNSVLGSRISYLFAEDKIEEIHQRIDKSLHYILFAGLGMTFGIIAVAPRFVPWFFGPGFNDTIQLLQMLSPIVLIIGISNCLGAQYYTPAGLRKQSARYIIVGAFVNLCLNIALIPTYGAKGAVAGSLMAEGTITVLYFRNCKSFLTIEQIVKNGWKKLLSSIVLFIMINITIVRIPDDTYALTISVIVGLFSYLLMLFVLKDSFVVYFVKMIYGRMFK